MQAAQARTREIVSGTIIRTRTEVVDRPYDGRPLTPKERRRWTEQMRDTPALLGSKQAEMATRYNLTEEKPFSRRLVDRISWGLKELEGEEG